MTTEIVNRDDVRMCEARTELRLRSKRSDERGIARERGVKLLHRDAPLEPSFVAIHGFVHRAARTGADFFDQPIFSKELFASHLRLRASDRAPKLA